MRVFLLVALAFCVSLALGATLNPQGSPSGPPPLLRRTSTQVAAVAQQDTPPLPAELKKEDIEARARAVCVFPDLTREPNGPWQTDPQLLLQRFFAILNVPNPTEYDIAHLLDRYIVAAKDFQCPGGAPGQTERQMFNFLKQAIGTGLGGRIAFDDTYADLDNLFNGRGNAQDLCRKIMKVVAADKEVLRQRAREVREKEYGQNKGVAAVVPPLRQQDFVVDAQYVAGPASNSQWAPVLIYTNAYFGYVRMLESYARMSHNCDGHDDDKGIRDWYTSRIAEMPAAIQKAATDHGWGDNLAGWRNRVLMASDYRHAHRVTARFCSNVFVRKMLELRDAMKYGSFSGPSLEFELNEKCRRLIKSPTNWLKSQPQTAESFAKETFVCVVQSAQRTNAAINRLQGITLNSSQDPLHNCPGSGDQEFEPGK